MQHFSIPARQCYQEPFNSIQSRFKFVRHNLIAPGGVALVEGRGRNLNCPTSSGGGSSRERNRKELLITATSLTNVLPNVLE
jgi:hypothetical protein